MSRPRTQPGFVRFDSLRSTGQPTSGRKSDGLVFVESTVAGRKAERITVEKFPGQAHGSTLSKLNKYSNRLMSVRNSRTNSTTNSASITTNSAKPKESAACHQCGGDSSITLYTSGVEVAHRMGRNQLSPMLPEMPVARLVAAISLRLGPCSSVVTSTVMATRVEVLSSRNPDCRAITSAYHSCNGREGEWVPVVFGNSSKS
uniref:Uncharacterized protein n=1 Tax=Anopheles farauti TaxID=69004 RepID=A0A182QTJ8_9DIPT